MSGFSFFKSFLASLGLNTLLSLTVDDAEGMVHFAAPQAPLMSMEAMKMKAVNSVDHSGIVLPEDQLSYV